MDIATRFDNHISIDDRYPNHSIDEMDPIEFLQIMNDAITAFWDSIATTRAECDGDYCARVIIFADLSTVIFGGDGEGMFYSVIGADPKGDAFLRAHEDVRARSPQLAAVLAAVLAKILTDAAATAGKPNALH
jgi:hypothetical protein